MFEAAIANSPGKSCDIVIANAGISRASGDDLWPLDGMFSWTRAMCAVVVVSDCSRP